MPTSSPIAEVFVGAREFFAERETRDRLNSDYSSASDTPSRLRVWKDHLAFVGVVTGVEFFSNVIER